MSIVALRHALWHRQLSTKDGLSRQLPNIMYLLYILSSLGFCSYLVFLPES